MLDNFYAPYQGQLDVVIIEPTTPPQARMDFLYDRYILPDSRKPSVIALSRRIISDAVRDDPAVRTDDVAQLQALTDWQARNVRYQEDPTLADGWQLELYKRAERAISDGEDDCDGKVTVFATLANAAGYPCIPAWIEQKTSRQNHVAALVCVPGAATSLPPPSDYDDLVMVLPERLPPVRGRWLWVELTLGAVRLGERIVPGPRVGEHPYAVVSRFRSAGVMRLGL
jgi:transglutaminase-like putative cysteine protease